MIDQVLIIGFILTTYYFFIKWYWRRKQIKLMVGIIAAIMAIPIMIELFLEEKVLD